MAYILEPGSQMAEVDAQIDEAGEEGRQEKTSLKRPSILSELDGLRKYRMLLCCHQWFNSRQSQ